MNKIAAIFFVFAIVVLCIFSCFQHYSNKELSKRVQTQEQRIKKLESQRDATWLFLGIREIPGLCGNMYTMPDGPLARLINEEQEEKE